MISVDLETTGLQPGKHDIASIGAVHVESGEEFYRECKIYNNTHISEKALEVNGFTEKQLREGKGISIGSAVLEFVRWVGSLGTEGEKEIAMGWNYGSFDNQFLEVHMGSKIREGLIGHRYIDLHSMLFTLTGESMKSYEACDYLGVEQEPEIHNALEGAKMNVRIYNAIMSRLHDHGTKDIDTWILTASGKKVHFNNSTKEMISLEDIAHGLSQTCRFAGQGNGFYSVGAHSISVAMMVHEAGGTRSECLQALLHDAAEAYLADVPGPAKIFLPDYQRLEKKLLGAIQEKFAPLDLVNLSPIVKWADRQHLHWEANQLFDNPDWTEEIDSDFLEDRKIITMQPMQTKLAFQEYYYELLDMDKE